MYDLAIFAALGWERRVVTAAFAGPTNGAGGGPWHGQLADGATCVVVQTGMGRERARTAAAGAPPARAFLACGCAGGLADWLRAGDLVAADRVDVVSASGEVFERLPAHAASLVAWAASRGLRVHQGTVVSTPGVLDTAGAKTAAAADGALAVEMESAAIAAEACARGIPFVGVRVVLDHAGQAVPLPGGVVDERTGELRAGRAVAGLALRPWLWPALGRLGRQQRVAARRLGVLVGALVHDGGMEALVGRDVPAVAVRVGEGG